MAEVLRAESTVPIPYAISSTMATSAAMGGRPSLPSPPPEEILCISPNVQAQNPELTFLQMGSKRQQRGVRQVSKSDSSSNVKSRTL